MAIEERGSLLHWNYFLALESDIERLARFVEFTSNNFATYSIEMAHLFLAVASEVDVISKQLCLMFDIDNRACNVEHYRVVLRHYLPEMESSIVSIPRYGLTLHPWENWQNDQTPDWWREYNKVKHQRDENFNLANLKNLLNAMAGLFLLILYYYRHAIDERKIEPPPNLFTPPSDLAQIGSSWGGPMALFFIENNE